MFKKTFAKAASGLVIFRDQWLAKIIYWVQGI